MVKIQGHDCQILETEVLDEEDRKLCTVKKGLFTNGVKKEPMMDAVSRDGESFTLRKRKCLVFS